MNVVFPEAADNGAFHACGEMRRNILKRRSTALIAKPHPADLKAVFRAGSVWPGNTVTLSAIGNKRRQFHASQPIAGTLFRGHSFRRPDLSYNLSGIQNQQTIKQAGQIVQAVLNHDHGMPFGFQSGQEPAQIADGNGVQVGGGLIKDIDARSHGVDRGEDHFLPLAAGQIEHFSVPQMVDAEQVERRIHATANFLLRITHVFGTEGDLIRHVDMEKLRPRILENGPDGRGNHLR